MTAAGVLAALVVSRLPNVFLSLRERFAEGCNRHFRPRSEPHAEREEYEIVIDSPVLTHPASRLVTIEREYMILSPRLDIVLHRRACGSAGDPPHGATGGPFWGKKVRISNTAPKDVYF